MAVRESSNFFGHRPVVLPLLQVRDVQLDGLMPTQATGDGYMGRP